MIRPTKLKVGEIFYLIDYDQYPDKHYFYVEGPFTWHNIDCKEKYFSIFRKKKDAEWMARQLNRTIKGKFI